MNIFAACSISSGAEMYSFIHSDQLTCISGLQFGISKYTAIMKFTTDNVNYDCYFIELSNSVSIMIVERVVFTIMNITPILDMLNISIHK